jgi:hypothetical protein
VRECALKRGHHDHVLAVLGEGGELLLYPFHWRGPSCLKRQFVLAQVGQHGHNSHLFVGELTLSPCGFSFDVILWGALSFILVSH